MLSMKARGASSRRSESDARDNKLTSFTGGSNPLKNLASLELIRLANNDLQALPDEVLRAPRLAWVALAGNPRLVGFGQLASALETTMARIDFSDAVALGKGASGSVRSASYRGTPCAVKELLETSSDGAARDELAVHERVAGATPSTLIKTLAIIREPPAVVMERLTKNARDREAAHHHRGAGRWEAGGALAASVTLSRASRRRCSTCIQTWRTATSTATTRRVGFGRGGSGTWASFYYNSSAPSA